MFYCNIEDIFVFDLSGSDVFYVEVIKEMGFEEEEWLVILLVLVFYFVFNLLEVFIVKSK